MSSLGSGQLSVVEVAHLLGVSRPRVWQLRKRPDFPAPAGTEGGKEYWHEAAILRWAAGAGRELAQRAPLLYRPVPPEALGSFTGSEVVAGHVVLTWSTPLGLIGVAYPPLTNTQGDLRGLSAQVPWLDCLVMVTPFFTVSDVELRARDRDDPTRVYEPTGPDILRVLGQPIPYWPPELRRPTDLLRWRPGADVAQILAIPDVDTTPWLQLADDLPAGGSARAALLQIARTVQERATDTARQDIELMREHGGPAVTIAAIPFTNERGTTPEPGEVIVRDGWLEILDRRDRLAAECVTAVWNWNGGRYFPFSGVLDIHPEPDTVSTEWAGHLQPAKPKAGHEILAPWHTRQPNAQWLVDPATLIPATRADDGTIRSCYPHFLPSQAPLAEVTFHQREVWIRTHDGRLWLAPRRAGNGLAYGYRGGSTYTLADTLNQLLNDITAPAPMNLSGADLPPGLVKIAQTDWPDGVTLTRKQLLDAQNAN